MKLENEVNTKELLSPKVLTCMLAGMLINLAVISFFILRVPYPSLEWGAYWIVRPLIVVPLAGLMGGLSYHILVSLLHQPGWKKILGKALGLVVYIVGLWMGIILGLLGTMWN